MKHSELRQMIREEIQNVLTEWSQTKLGEDEYWVRIGVFVPKSTKISSVDPWTLYQKDTLRYAKKHRANIVHKLRWGNFGEMVVTGFGSNKNTAVSFAKETFDEVSGIDTAVVLQGPNAKAVKKYDDK